MGCGASKKKKKRKDSRQEPEEPDEADDEDDAQPEPQREERKAEEDKKEEKEAQDDKPARPRVPEKKELLPLRDKMMPASMVREYVGTEEQGTYIVSCFMPKGQTTGTVFAARAISKGQVFACDITDEKLSARKEDQAEDCDFKHFWRSLINAFGRNEGMKIEVNKNSISLEVSLKQGKDSKGSFQVDLESKGQSAMVGYKYILEPFLRPPKEDVDDDDRRKDEKKSGLPEKDLYKKEAQYSMHEATLAANQAMVAKGSELETMKEKMAEDRAKLQQDAILIDQLRRTLTKAHGNTMIDDMYDCLDLHDPREVHDVEIKEWGVWELDLVKLAAAYPDNTLCSVALSLLEHHGLISALKLDRKTLTTYWSWIQTQCNQNPYHNAVRSAANLLWLHHILTAGGMITILDMSSEDIMAAVLGMGLSDICHKGKDPSFEERTRTFVHTLYSGLFALEQNRLTTAFEVMENPRLNILAPVPPDKRKEIRDTVVEMVFMRANAKACTQKEKFEEFTEKLDDGEKTDWTKPEMRHIAMTVLVPLCEYAPWALPREQHLQVMQRVATEFYAQGDTEKEMGIAAGVWPDTKWTSDRTLHKDKEKGFPGGMAAFIKDTVLPVYTTVIELLPALQPHLDQVKANKTYWEEQAKEVSRSGGDKGMQTDKKMAEALSSFPKLFGVSNGVVVLCYAAPHAKGLQFLAASERELCYHTEIDRAALEAARPDSTLKQIVDNIRTSFEGQKIVCHVSGPKCNVNMPGWSTAALGKKNDPVMQETMYRAIGSYLRMRTYTREREAESDIDSVKKKADELHSKAREVDSEYKKLSAVMTAIRAKKHRNTHSEKRLRDALNSVAEEPEDKELVPEAEGVVRNPLAAPRQPGQDTVPEFRPIDRDLFTLVKSKWCAGKAPADALWANVMQPLTESEFSKQSKHISDSKRRAVFGMLEKLDSWDYDVFDLQQQMTGGYDHYGLSNQPNGGSLFITAYALMFKYDFMRKFNIGEQRLINWLSIVEAGYHPNPYHNSMHAADVLHVAHYIMHMGGLIAKCKVPDDEVFAVLLSAAIHDYNHPGINNAFHVKTQNYLAILFNDRSVNENIHTSSIFELMRMDAYNILGDIDKSKSVFVKSMMVELVLGTDMGLHTQFLTRFKKRLEKESEGTGMYKTFEDRLLSLTMALKMSDISNCGRPQKIYHGWCNQIADEFFLQGDREMLLGLTVSPFMDRYTTVMAKGQIAFMNYIVVPLFECMAEWLPKMSCSTENSEQNKAFWQNNEDW